MMIYIYSSRQIHIGYSQYDLYYGAICIILLTNICGYCSSLWVTHILIRTSHSLFQEDAYIDTSRILCILIFIRILYDNNVLLWYNVHNADGG